MSVLGVFFGGRGISSRLKRWLARPIAKGPMMMGQTRSFRVIKRTVADYSHRSKSWHHSPTLSSGFWWRSHSRLVVWSDLGARCECCVQHGAMRQLLLLPWRRSSMHCKSLTQHTEAQHTEAHGTYLLSADSDGLWCDGVHCEKTFSSSRSGNGNIFLGAS